jgi:hypothetical protein
MEGEPNVRGSRRQPEVVRGHHEGAAGAGPLQQGDSITADGDGCGHRDIDPKPSKL